GLARFRDEAGERLAALRPREGHWREERPCESGAANPRRTQRGVGEMEQTEHGPALARRPDRKTNRARTEGEAIAGGSFPHTGRYDVQVCLGLRRLREIVLFSSSGIRAFSPKQEECP